MRDEDLAVRDATEQRFRTLFSAHERDLLGYAMRRTDDPADAADVVAETFLVAWRRLAEVPVGFERPWLFGVAARVMDNQRRSGSRRGRLSQRLAEQLRVHPPVVRGPDHADPAVTAVDTAMAQLSGEDRELLRLTAWEGLSPSECAVVLGCSAVTARSRLHRARGRLRGHLESSGTCPDETRTKR